MILPKPKDAMRGFLAITLLACFMVALFWLFQRKVPPENLDLVVYMLGQLSTLAAGAMVYYFGTSKSSADKNEIIQKRTREPDHVDDAGNPVPIRHTRPPMPSPTFGHEAGDDWSAEGETR